MMKPVLVLFAAMTTLVFTACQKEVSYETPTGSNVNGVLKMKIDGQQWVADVVATAGIMNGYINISGISKDKKTFTITLLDDEVGSYTLNPIVAEGGAALSDSMDFSPDSYATVQGDDSTLAGGTVTVTKIDTVNKTISGTFQFKLFRELDSAQKIITEGVFDNLKYETTLPPGNSTDTLHVKIDGTDWKAETIFSTYVSLTDQISIVANNLTVTKTVGFFMPKDITPGSYSLDFLGLTYIGQYNPTSSLSLISESGTLTILEHNTTTKRIRGNFDFKATELVPSNPPNLITAQLTDGYFSVVYQ